MSRFLPLFPLGLIVFPGESLRLHIFEQRYKQLIRECVAESKTFGIPAVIDKKVVDIATEVEIISVDKEYPKGEMDISTLGIRRVEIETFFKVANGKLYPGGEVKETFSNGETDPALQRKVLDQLEQLHQALGVPNRFNGNYRDLRSFLIAHHVGLSIEQEYQLLQLNAEVPRLDFIHKHLTHILPIVVETERLKAKARLNGHYKNIVPPDY